MAHTQRNGLVGQNQRVEGAPNSNASSGGSLMDELENFLSQTSKSNGSLLEGPQAVTALRDIFKKWKAGGFAVVPKPGMVLYLLGAENRVTSIAKGLDDLKGVDAHRVRSFLAAAEAEGIVVGEGMLAMRRSGPTAANEFDDEEEDDWLGLLGHRTTSEMLEIHEETIELEEISGITTDQLSGLRKIKIDNSKSFVPKTTFERLTPVHSHNSSGCMFTKILNQRFRRGVLIFLLESGLEEILCRELGATRYGLKKLAEIQHHSVTPEASKWFELILKEKENWTSANASDVLGEALKFKSEEFWTAASDAKVVTVTMLGDAELLGKALSTFGFEKCRASFELVLSRSTKLGERIQFIRALSTHASSIGEKRVQDWSLQETRRVLTSCSSATPSDIPILLELLKGKDTVKEVEAMITQNLLDSKNIFDFWAAFLPSLAALRTPQAATVSTNASEGSPPTNTHVDQQLVSTLIEQTFQRLVAQWDQTGFMHISNQLRARIGFPIPTVEEETRTNAPRVNRVIEVTKQCLVHRRMDICVLLLKSVLRVFPPEEEHYRASVYSPLVAGLIDLLQEYNLSIRAPPFAAFFHILIAHQLHTIPPLGMKIRSMRCKCQYCEPINKFLQMAGQDMYTLRVVQQHRLHVEANLRTVGDMCTYTNQAQKRPVRTEIKKTKALLDEERRTEIHQAAVKFLQVFSRTSQLELQNLMGPRWNDVQEALQAKKRYALPTIESGFPGGLSGGGVASNLPPAGPASGTSASAASAARSTVAIAGQKRKQVS